MKKRESSPSDYYPLSTYSGVSRNIERVVKNSRDLSVSDQAKIVIELHAASMKIENRLRGLNGKSI